MNKEKRVYIAIDLKSFYASVECQQRNLNPLTTNLVVADPSRTQKTICLAVSPSLKAYGIGGRPRLFEVEAKVKEINQQRLRRTRYHQFKTKSYDDVLVRSDCNVALDYVIAPPQMAHYIQVSSKIYEIYLRYIAPEDIHVYSIDEVFMDVTSYLKTYQLKPRELAQKMILDVLKETGITATAGIGTNLYLCKVAMDIVAKHIDADAHGVRIAALNETTYRKLLWNHRPLTDFWRVGKGYAKKLEAHGLYTMGDIARCSIENEDLLFTLFGVNAELLIDHAWGYEPCLIEDIKAYKPAYHSVGTGQVLHCAYTFDKAKLVVKEMVDSLVLDLVDKGFVCDQFVLTVGYDIDNLKDERFHEYYDGEIKTDVYGRKIPKSAHGTIRLEHATSSTKYVMDAVMNLFDRIVHPHLLIRRLNLVANQVILKEDALKAKQNMQLDLFTNIEQVQKQEAKEQAFLDKEAKMQKALLDIKKKFGKNAVMKVMDLEEGATAKDKNNQIGGHKA